jgi:hypothetical protein
LRVRTATALFAGLGGLASWGASAAPPPAIDWPVKLVDVAESAGLRQASVYGGIEEKRFIIETNGAGVALLDYDLGAIVLVTAGGRTQARAALSQSSYYSHDDLRLHFGLGSSATADRVEVRWPSGQVDAQRNVAGGQVVTIREGAAGRSTP